MNKEELEEFQSLFSWNLLSNEVTTPSFAIGG